MARSPRRARGVLFWGGAIFLTIQLIASLLLDYRWPLLRFPSAAQVMANVRQQPAPPDLVLLGSSRFACGLYADDMAQLLERDCRLQKPVTGLNAAVPAGDVVTAEYLLGKLLRTGARPRAVLVEVSPETLNLYNEWLNFHIRRQLRWHEVPAYFLDICRVRQGFYLLSDRFCPLYIHRQEVWNAAAQFLEKKPLPPAAPPRPVATEPIDWERLLQVHERPMPKELWDLIQYTTVRLPGRWLRRFEVGGTSVAALERLLQKCQKKGIRVVLVGVPVTSPHRGLYKPPIEEPFQAYLARVTRKFGCQFVDYRGRIPDTLFVDNHHLSPDGQLHFGRLLVHEVLAPLWRGHTETAEE